jgi:hypothetical protein
MERCRRDPVPAPLELLGRLVALSAKDDGNAELSGVHAHGDGVHGRLRAAGVAILEGSFELLLVNARHVKMVPGRKIDVKDCEWIAQLLEHGPLRRSFVRTRRCGSCAS